MMFDYEYYLKNINNYESVINNMHNNLSRSNVDKIQNIKKTLFKFRTAIIDSEFEIFHTNSLLEKINNLLTTITELLNGAYLYRIFTIKNTNNIDLYHNKSLFISCIYLMFILYLQ